MALSREEAGATRLRNPGSRIERLSLAVLGVSLVVLISAAWGTGIVYLMARAGLPAPLNLAVNGALHLYVGLVSAVVVGAKVLRVGLRRRVPGVPATTLWQRWISLSLVILYSVIYLSGLLALIPLGSRVHGLAVNAHLLSSVWALFPTTIHLVHHRLRAVPLLKHWSPPRAPRIWPALAIALIAGLGFAFSPRAVEPLAAVGAGRPWTAAGLDGIYLNRVALTRDGRLLAAGDGLYLSANGRNWRHVDLPSGNADAERLIELGIKPSSNQPTVAGGSGHGDHANNASVGQVIALAVSPKTGYVYVASTEGVYYSPWPEGPYLSLPSPGKRVDSLAVDPASAYQLWVTTEAGPELSIDGGHVWTPLTAGLQVPARATSLAYLAGVPYVVDPGGVYRFDASAVAWNRVFRADDVVSLAMSVDSASLFAAGLNGEVWQYDGHRWKAFDLVAAHNHRISGHAHTHGVTADFGRLYAIGTRDGVTASADAGTTWTPLGIGLPEADVTGAIGYRDRVLVTTASGIYSIPAPTAPTAGLGWWLLLALVTGIAGTAIVVWAAVRPRGPASA